MDFSDHDLHRVPQGAWIVNPGGEWFRATTNGAYAEPEVFNWTYINEQREKTNWDAATSSNPYAELTQMRMYTYAMGVPGGEWAADGEFDGFDLNTYFKAKRTEDGYVFERPEYVASFRDLIRGKGALPRKGHRSGRGERCISLRGCQVQGRSAALGLVSPGRRRMRGDGRPPAQRPVLLHPRDLRPR